MMPTSTSWVCVLNSRQGFLSILFGCILLTSCNGPYKPGELPNPHDLPKKPGLFSGENGAFVLYESGCKPSKVEEVAEEVDSLDTPEEKSTHTPASAPAPIPAPAPVHKPTPVKKPTPVVKNKVVEEFEVIDEEPAAPIVKAAAPKKTVKKALKKPQKGKTDKKSRKKKKAL